MRLYIHHIRTQFENDIYMDILPSTKCSQQKESARRYQTVLYIRSSSSFAIVFFFICVIHFNKLFCVTLSIKLNRHVIFLVQIFGKQYNDAVCNVSLLYYYLRIYASCDLSLAITNTGLLYKIGVVMQKLGTIAFINYI